MSMNQFQITGRVVDAVTGTGIEDIHVELWDKDLIFDDLLGSADTDADGRFGLKFNETYFREVIERRPDLYFKVFQEGAALPAAQYGLSLTLPDGTQYEGTGDKVFWNLLPGHTGVRIKLGLVPETALYVVKGRVTEPDGRPIVGAAVRVWDVRMVPESGQVARTPLGHSITDEDGRYRVSYPAKVFLDWGKQRPDLDVQAVDAEGERIAWLPNPPLFNAGPSVTIDLVRNAASYLGPSTFELSIDALGAALQGADLAVLNPEAVNWLIGKTGRDSRQVVELVKAARLSVLTGQPPQLFYALFQVGLPQTLPALVAQSPQTVRFALQRAAEQNLIPADNLEGQADALLASFQTKIVDLAMQDPEEPERLSLGSLLKSAVDATIAEQFLTAYVAHSGPIEAFWTELQDDSVLKDHVAILQLTLQLGALSVNHRPMLDTLWEMHGAGEFASLGDLVDKSEDDWLGIVTSEDVGVPPHIPGADDDEKALNYARVIADMLEQSFPTAFVTARLPDDDPLKPFLMDHTDFDLKATHIGAYLRQKAIRLDDVELNRLRAMQRVYRLAPRWRAAGKMLDDGLDSACRISRQGRNVFYSKYKERLGPREARCVYERAHQVHAMGLRLLAEAGRFPAGTSLQVVHDAPVTEFDGDPEVLPEWQALFQDSLELCNCEHCRSVLGPAAYLVDVLHFLSDRNAADEDGGSAMDVLFERRADLGTIELSCENSLTPVPYVDLVNEILEDAVAPSTFSAFTLELDDGAHDFEADLNAQRVSDALLDVFRANACPLERPVIRVGGEGQRRTPLQPWWAIDDVHFTYNIRKRLGNKPLLVTSRSRQTLGSAAERRAMPQYFNPEAYERLRAQPEPDSCKPRVHPWSLPFDRDWEIIRSHLGHLQTSRARILETFLPGERKDILSDSEVVHETLGLTSGEAMIIADDVSPDCALAWRPSDEPWQLWGFASESIIERGKWLNVIAGSVETLLQQSGLSYRELLDLLGTYYVNPIDGDGRTLHVVSKEPDHPDTCATDQLEVCGLDEDEDAAVRMVRFVRLWRRLGWSMRELDCAVTALTPPDTAPDIDADFLRDLSALVRLRQRLGLPVERILPFWGRIGTAVYIDHGEPGQPRLPSQYEKLFRNRSILELPDPDFPENPDDLADPDNPTWTWDNCAATIASALGISADALRLLLADDNVLDPAEASLRLDNLSRLYRHATLAKALKLSIPDYLSILALQNIAPFSSPIDTLLFVEDIELIQSSGFTIAELDYLLRHTDAAVQALAPAETEIAAVLERIRTALQGIADEHGYRDPEDQEDQVAATHPLGVTVDADGALTRDRLALLVWDSSRIDQVIATLNDAVVYRALLPSLPETVAFPPDLRERISFDADAQELSFIGVMLASQRDVLQQLAPDGDTAYQAALASLFESPRLYLVRNLRAFSVPDFSAELQALPAGFVIPPNLRDKLYFAESVDENPPNRLRFRGIMTEVERDQLCDLTDDAMFKTAVEALFDKPRNPPTSGPERWPRSDEDRFFDPAELEALIGDDVKAASPSERFRSLLKRLLPYLRTTLGRAQTIQLLADRFGIETPTCARLLTDWLVGREAHHPNAIDAFLDPRFAESSPRLPITRDAFPDQFDTFGLLHKVALVIVRLNLSLTQLAWLFELERTPWPDLNNLIPPDSSLDLEPLKHLWSLSRVCETLDPTEDFLGECFAIIDGVADDAEEAEKSAAKQRVFDEFLEARSGWLLESLETMLGTAGDCKSTGLLGAVFPADYRGEHLLCRLQDCFRLLKDLGVTADLCGGLCDRLHRLDHPGRGRRIANQVVQAVHAKYDPVRWLEVATPLRDQLRELQRAALVAFLTASTPDRPWRDANDLYSHYLIDPEMSPCMMTSRIKQAHGVVQLFVQRCRMNLEPEVPANDVIDDAWRQWQWMKNYRVWEANRKVFLYPENWIEPELRDDKSPFFKELEGELLQTDLTLESAAQAMLGYLQKLDEIAKLEIVGCCLQGETTRSRVTTPAVLHVFGRTRQAPRVYYYRRRLGSAHWTPWEQVDLDIQGDHLIPVIWNRRLYLFWPLFVKKPKQATPSATTKLADMTSSDIIPDNEWEIKLARSEYRNGAWSKKTTSNTAVRMPVIQGFTEKEDGFSFRYWSDDRYATLDIVIWAHNTKILRELKNIFITKTKTLLGFIQIWIGFVANFSNETDVDAIRKCLDNIEESNNESFILEQANNLCNHLKTLSESIRNPFYGGFVQNIIGTTIDFARRIQSEATAFTQFMADPTVNHVQCFTFRETADAEPEITCKFADLDHDDPVDLVDSRIESQIPYGLRLFRQNLQCTGCRILYLPTPDDNRALQFQDAEQNPMKRPFVLVPQANPKELCVAPFFYQDRNYLFAVTPHQIGPRGSDVQIEKYDPPYSKLDDVWKLDPAQLEAVHALRPDVWRPEWPLPDWAITDPLDPPEIEMTIPWELYDDTGIADYAAPPWWRIDTRHLTAASSVPPETLTGLATAKAIVRPAGTGMVIHHDLNVEDEHRFYPGPTSAYAYRFETFYHPYAPTFINQLRIAGLDGLLQRALQREPDQFESTREPLDFDAAFQPADFVEAPGEEDVWFDLSDDVVLAGRPDAYGLYNSELFFHAPLLIADRLMQNQRFEEAQKWLHYIFDPTDRSGEEAPQRYWQTRPFFERSAEDYQRQHIAHILDLLARSAAPGGADALNEDEKAELAHWQSSVQRWRTDAFQPHLIARMRPVAYQKAVVMKYLDNLIAWGDQLFRRDTIESITEATQLYILAAEILGPRPEDIPPRSVAAMQTFDAMKDRLGDFSNAVVAVEHFIPPSAGQCQVELEDPIPATPTMLYFCPPRNEKLLGYWDLVADRLFKIRHCMNIEGVVRQLPLYEPPIEPGLLVRAKAAGVDIGSVLNDITGGVPHYRFAVMVQKATELCSELKSLGASLLGTLEKKDVEVLSQMRARHESKLLELLETVKKQQLDEVQENLRALRRSRDEAIGRYLHYQKLLGAQSPQLPTEGQDIPLETASPHINIKNDNAFKSLPHEQQEDKQYKNAMMWQELAHGMDVIAAGLHYGPVVKAAFWGVGTELGGRDFGAAASSFANKFRAVSAKDNYDALRAGRLAQRALRAHDWLLQSNQAARQIMQIDAQILAGEIRVAIASKELDNHAKQREQAEQIETFLRGKFTNDDLYGWMSGQISSLYFQTYQLAFDIAKRAERAFRSELGIEDSDYIRFGHWDGLKKGLLAGEKLSLDIKRLETAYHEKNRREYELTKHISVLQVDPLALVRLRETGTCTVALPEALFDMDGPGHYFRRIKNVAISIPCVAGPYTSVNCKLTLLHSSLRKSPRASGENDYPRQAEDNRFIDYFGSIESIVASSGDSDSGLFEPNLRDERYLPFENAGVIGEWRLELPADPSAAEPCQFDYSTVSDVILHLRFTARDGGETLRSAAKASLKSAIEDGTAGGSVRLFSIRNEFPGEWARFKSQADNEAAEELGGTKSELAVSFKPEHYPFWSRAWLGHVEAVEMLTAAQDVEAEDEDEDEGVPVYKTADSEDPTTILTTGSFGPLLYAELPKALLAEPCADLRLFFAPADTRAITDMWVAVHWRA